MSDKFSIKFNEIFLQIK